jgi:ABC-2 type transport system permease protein
MRRMLIAVLGETRKGLMISWTYRVNLLTSLATVAFVFVGISLLMGRGRPDPRENAGMLLGFVAWFYAAAAISDMSYSIRSETQAGTLEQMSMSPAPFALLLLGRVLANFLVTTAQLLIMGLVLVFALRIPLPLRWEGLPVLAITLVGVFGFGYMIAGATLVFKNVESLANLVQNVLLFLNGTLLPVALMPRGFQFLAQTMPSTQGIILLRNTMLGGQTLGSAWADGSLVWLVVHSCLYFAAGWFLFGRCLHVARRQGSLGQY